MRKGIVILIIWMSFMAGKSQEFDFYAISPCQTVEVKDSVLDPFSLKSKELGKSSITLRDSVYFFIWSSVDSLWERVSSSLYAYDENHYRVSTFRRDWVSDSWENDQLLEYFYDDKGNRQKELEKHWNGAGQNWINKYQKLFSFNEYHNLVGYIVQYWSGNDLSWKDSLRYLYDYDEYQNWTCWEKQTWDPDSLKWISNLRFLWVYEEGIMTMFVRQEGTSNNWINTNWTEYFYDQYGNLTEEIQFSSQGKTRISYLYNPQHQVIEKLYQSWDVDSYETLALYTYQYTLVAKLSEIVYFWWNSTNWDTTYRYLFDYDDHSTLIRETDQKWSPGEGKWLNELKWEYYSTHLPGQLEAFISDSTNVSCFDYSDGTATVSISGGTPPYSILWNDPQNTTYPIVYGLSANQYYTVTVTDGDLNSVSDSVILSQPPEIITGPIYGEVFVNQNDTITYQVESDTSSIYSWFVMNGQILFEQGVDSIIVLWTEPGQGKVSVIESTTYGCQGDTVHANISISPTTINENHILHIHIYPNPASQLIHIQLDGNEYNQWDLEIYDMTGKIIRSYPSLSDNRIQVPLGTIRRGVYFFKIMNSSGTVIRKVVIER